MQAGAKMNPLRLIVALGELIGLLVLLVLPVVAHETSSPTDVVAESRTPSSTSSPLQTTTSTAGLDMAQIKIGLVALVRLNGHRCDTLTKWHPMAFSRGYEVDCDLHYSYDVEDKGGRWIVTVK